MAAPRADRDGSRLVGVMNARNRPAARTADDVHGHLFQAIVDQRLLPGTKLTELALVETFGLGRRVVGAALQRLVWERLLVSAPNRGVSVAAPDVAEARDIFAARVAIEGGTTEAVARAGNPAHIARLEENLAHERALRDAGRVREAIHFSGGFHVLMAELSGNRILADLVRVLVARTSLVISLFGNQDGLAGWHAHHDELVRLCRDREAEQAARLMRAHIVELETGLALDRHPTTFDMIGVFGR